MRSNKFLTASLLILLAGVSVAQVGSRVELKYRNSFSDIKIAKDNINSLRTDLNQASAADLAKSREETARLINSDLPLQFQAVEFALSKEFGATEISLSSLKPEQLQELRSTINATSPEAGVELDSSVTGEEFSLYITLSMKDISAKGSQLLELVNGGSASEIQIAKSELSLALARFDILTAYLVIGVESSSPDL
ncbi:hypothetical protein [Rhizobium sp. 'Codium 1']|uniref:hypothetical protein n=1 Tax=Rhizobium sp. 'Codium 1' TaxID=2940484 RepID=UPI001E45BD27|nr:hypothetical protein [Rhizobium sp. 'Codium 1']MCC8934606.1 hypothetical protein [Rhizobium sp. 'Codium 1']